MKKHIPWWRYLIYLLILGLWFIWYTNIRVLSGTSDIAFSCEALEPYPVGMVLGARAYHDHQVSPIFADRLETAVSLYQSGVIKKILVSGDHGQKEYDEVVAGRNYLMKKGVPADDIFLDHAGFSTYDSVYRAQAIFQAPKILLITQNFHLPRALYFAQKKNLPALGCPADHQAYRGLAQMQQREVLARTKGWLSTFFKVKPKYLGPLIDLSGSGQQTWDDLDEVQG